LLPELIALHIDVDPFDVTFARQRVAQNSALARGEIIDDPACVFLRP
jgi:hypothetical protein